MNLILHHKFPHWSEVLSVLKYNTVQNDDEYSDFMAFSRRSEEYIDPVGTHHKIYTKGSFNSDDIYVCNGSIHLETFPMSVGKIPFSKFPRKIGIEHTSSIVMYDHLAMVDLAKISADDPENAQGSKFIFFMYKKVYDAINQTDWSNYPDFDNYKKNIIPEMIDRGYIKVVDIEPSQYWLCKVPRKTHIRNDSICIMLNWSNFKKDSYVKELLDRCIKLHEVTSKDIYIKLHTYTKENFLKRFDSYDYIYLFHYDDCNKYDIMDSFTTYFVDGTGIGYETSYRAKIFEDDINIYYMEGLPAENEEFRGLLDTRLDGYNLLPQVNYSQFIDNPKLSSNYNSTIIDRLFPHTGSINEIPNTVYHALTDNLENYFNNLK